MAAILNRFHSMISFQSLCWIMKYLLTAQTNKHTDKNIIAALPSAVGKNKELNVIEEELAGGSNVVVPLVNSHSTIYLLVSKAACVFLAKTFSQRWSRWWKTDSNASLQPCIRNTDV